MIFSRLTFLVSFLALFQMAVAGFDQLQIGVTHKVEDCTRQAHKGDVIDVHYTGSLTDGTVFDSSLNRGKPLTFTLGVGQVIQGWDQGVMGMCIGEKRKLSIPSELGYGKRGAGGAIPPNADLVFTVELVGIKGVEKDEL